MLALNPSDYTDFFVVVVASFQIVLPWLVDLSQKMAVFINIKLDFYSNVYGLFCATDDGWRTSCMNYGLWLARKRPKLTHFQQQNNINHRFIASGVQAAPLKQPWVNEVDQYVSTSSCWPIAFFFFLVGLFASLVICHYALMTSKHGTTVFTTRTREKHVLDQRTHKCDAKQKLSDDEGKSK